jgi:hypothetical protein
MGSLYLNVEGVNSETAGTIANEVAQHYFEDSTVSAESALLRSIRHAYRFLYDARLETSLANIGLTAVVIRKGRASIAQVLPTQFFLLQEGQLTALPETHDRLGGQSASSAHDDRYPKWDPPVEMFRATLFPQDVALLCTDNVGAVLSDDEVDVILSDRNLQSAADNLIDTVRKRGERDASVLLLRFVSAKESTMTMETLAQVPEPESGQGPREPRTKPRSSVVGMIAGVALALVIMTGAAIASLFRSRGQTSVPASRVSGQATQSTIVARNAAEDARRQRLNRIVAGIVVLLALVLLVIGANVLFGGEDSTSTLVDGINTPVIQREESQTQSATPSVASPVPTADAGTPSPPALEPGSTFIDELQVLVRFDAAVKPGEIYGLDGTMYVLYNASGAVYRITAGANESIYQPGTGGPARYVTGRADVIQIIDSQNRLFQLTNDSLPQVAQLPTGSIQEPVASATYDQNFYLLDTGANDVLRFRPVGGGDYSEPEGYFGVNSGFDLSQAIDLAIDGSIFVLFADGVISRYEFGTLATFDLTSLPSPLGTPGAIFISQGMGSLYILDGENDRIVQVTTEGVYQRQLLAPDNLFATAVNLYVNQGETYLWIVGPTGVTRIPLPDLPADAPRSSV